MQWYIAETLWPVILAFFLLISVRPVPSVLLVLEGGQGTLKTVRATINKNIPVVVIAGSGRAADLIDFAANNKQLYV